MNLHAHTNPSRHPGDIDRPSPAPAEIERTPTRQDETGTQREYEDAPANPDPDAPTAPGRERPEQRLPATNPRPVPEHPPSRH